MRNLKYVVQGAKGCPPRPWLDEGGEGIFCATVEYFKSALITPINEVLSGISVVVLLVVYLPSVPYMWTFRTPLYGTRT